MVNNSAVSGHYYAEHAVDGNGRHARLTDSFCSQTVSFLGVGLEFGLMQGIQSKMIVK